MKRKIQFLFFFSKLCPSFISYIIAHLPQENLPGKQELLLEFPPAIKMALPLPEHRHSLACKLHLTTQEKPKVSFSLNSSASSLDKCYLVIQTDKDAVNEAQQLLEFPIKISFQVTFDF